MTPEFWRGRRVLVTGHTGFKGTWLCAVLRRLGAEVHGYALDPLGATSTWEALARSGDLAGDTRADLADRPALHTAFEAARPQVVLHLAAQSLVRPSYADPLGTLATNVMGTAHVLECCRAQSELRAVVVVTSDKCYANREWVHPYRETDPMGGHDLYSASKGCAELVADAYRTSILGDRTNLATARAGNVIGGGDWAEGRLVPDCIRAFATGQPVFLRHPSAVRPWQHVLESLSGYLLLAERLSGPDGASFASGWNFGPDPGGEATVLDVARGLAGLWGDGARAEAAPNPADPHEANQLRLDSTKARVALGWQPRWAVRRALAETLVWYQTWADGGALRELTDRQVTAYLDPEMA